MDKCVGDVNRIAIEGMSKCVVDVNRIAMSVGMLTGLL